MSPHPGGRAGRPKVKRTSPARLPSASCGAPPEVENAYAFGRRREEYPVHSVLRYQCKPGFRQRRAPVVRCRADGQWERPRVECTHGEGPTGGRRALYSG